ncbi:MAG: proteasome assembly chaperone family protein [Candidatus Heimdallarchaeota archaeon]|nr:MAG: proteasome assembly chaperone family protein [Candidatus Heimdallarchaeota archaeon]
MKFKIFVEQPEILNKCQVFISGWHGLGEIGYITVSHLIQELNMERIATIMSSGAPPFISVQENQLRLPFEIYGKQDLNFAVFIPHLQPYRHVQIEFSEKLSEWILGHKNLEMAFFIGGVDIHLKTSDSNLQYIPSRAFNSYSRLPDGFTEEVNTNLLDPGLFVAGPLAIMLGYLDMNMFPAIGLLAYAERDRPDPLGAVAAVEKLNTLLQVEVKTNALIRNARVIEEEIKRQLAPMEETEKDKLTSRRMYT